MSEPFSFIHLSDLHFGRIHCDILRDLEAFIERRKEEIDLAILTGDFTQRARSQEFKDAREFVSSLSCPLFIVPGNHDVPLYNLFLRFLSPYKKFMKYLGPFAQNYYEDDRLAIYGLWTVDNFSVKDGRLSSKDLRCIEERFAKVPAEKIKIVASHHPLEAMKKEHMDRVLDLDPHFFLWGHEHQSQVRSYHDDRKFPLVVASGTSTSSRTRAEVNSFNYVTVMDGGIRIEIYHHSEKKRTFEPIRVTEIPLRH